MTKKVDVWMPWLIDKYLGDTSHLTTEQHGAYCLLLMAMWKADGELPNNDLRLRAITRLEPAKWRQHRETLMEFFRLDEGAGVLRQKRLSEELQRSKENVDARSQAGKAGAAARWGSGTENDGNGNAIANGKRNGKRIANGKQTTSQTGGTISTPIPPASQDEYRPSASSAETPTIPCPYAEIVGAYHDTLPMLPRVRLMTESRQKALRKVWGWVLRTCRPDGSRRATNADEALSWFRDYFERATENDFLMGKTPRSAEHRNWRCDLDYLLTESGMKQVIEKTHDEHAA